MASPDISENEAPDITTLTNVNVDVESGLPQRSFSQAKYYKQTYRPEWELMPDFQGWLSCVSGEPTRAYCKFCEKTLHAHRLSLLKHTCTLKHTRAAKNAFNKQQQSAHMVERRVETRKPEPAAQVSEEAPVLPAPSSTPKEMVPPSLQDYTLKGVSCADAGPEHATETMAVDQVPSGYVPTPAPAEGTNTPVATSTVPSVAHHNPCKTVIITEVPHQSENCVDPLDEGCITTHVLDTSKGRPVAGLMVSLYRLVDGRWTHLAESLTYPDGRCTGFVRRNSFVAGRYKLHYDVDRYYERRRIDSLYPFIEIVFDVRSPQEHYHIPLLLSPYGYTTYKGS